MSCGIVYRRGLDLALLWLWLWPAAAALIWALAWEHRYTTGVPLKRQKKKKKRKRKVVFTLCPSWCFVVRVQTEQNRCNPNSYCAWDLHREISAFIYLFISLAYIMRSSWATAVTWAPAVKTLGSNLLGHQETWDFFFYFILFFIFIFIFCLFALI